MKFFKKIFCCLLALSVSGLILYADILSSFPSQINMNLSEVHNKSLGIGVKIGNMPQEVYASSGADKITPLQQGEFDAVLKVINIPFKKITVSVSGPKSLCASGELIGLRLYNKGLIVTNLAPVTSCGKEQSPAQNAGILPGDVILEINNKIPKNCEEVPHLLTEKTSLTLKRHNSLKTVTVEPVTDDNDGLLKIGIWARDSSAGVGTMTYTNPDTLTYGALGHGISDSDTGILFDVASGSIEKSRVVSVEPGKSGTPGQITGSFYGGETVAGTVTKNCEAGIFGNIFPHSEINSTIYPVGVMSQVETGDATILSTVDEGIKEYKIRILRAMPFGSATKGLAIEITDPELLSKTGGIVQGMSGSPILQNGRIIGAVTHVLVNDPTRGYGIFIENMLAETK